MGNTGFFPIPFPTAMGSTSRWRVGSLSCILIAVIAACKATRKASCCLLVQNFVGLSKREKGKMQNQRHSEMKARLNNNSDNKLRQTYRLALGLTGRQSQTPA